MTALNGFGETTAPKLLLLQQRDNGGGGVAGVTD
jgi:hypothetical protein